MWALAVSRFSIFLHYSLQPFLLVFSKMAAENSNKFKWLKLKTYISTKKSTFTLVTLQSLSFSGVISAEKI